MSTFACGLLNVTQLQFYITAQWEDINAYTFFSFLPLLVVLDKQSLHTVGMHAHCLTKQKGKEYLNMEGIVT